MAITKTSKLGLPQYSSGNDPHPGRVDHNAIMLSIENGAMGAGQGPHDSRPGAGVPGRVYFSTDRQTAAYDDGTKWVEVVPIGGVAPSPVSVGGANNEGTSARVARADHVHLLPLASASASGAMSDAHYTLLNGATSGLVANRLVQRDVNGNASVATPSALTHAANKMYVDNVSSDASNLTTGTIPVGRLPLASASAAGAMSAAHYSALVGATPQATPSTLFMRNSDGDGTIRQLVVTATAPTIAGHAARKDYVDAGDNAAKSYADGLVGTSAAPISHTHSATDINSGVLAAARLPLASASAAGAMSVAHYSLLAGATSVATANTLVKNDANGRFQTATPSAAADVANKAYVDGKTWDGADITTGLINQARIANATASLNGLMSSTDKAKLDAATPNATANTLVMNDSAGRFNVATPSASTNAANKAYVDSQMGTRAPLSHNHDASDINSGVLAYARIPNLSADSTNTWLSLLTSSGGMRIATSGQFYTVSDNGSGTMQTDFAVRSNGNAYVRGTVPISANDLTRKDYVDAQDAKQVSLGGDLGSTDLNTLITPGDYFVSSGANGVTANNYPINAVGTVSVRRFHNSSVWVIQTFQSWNSNRMFARSTNSATGWTAWVEFPNADRASQAAFGGTAIDGPVNLDDYTTPGVFVNSLNSNATNGQNFPRSIAGVLNVFSTVSASMVWQTYTEYSSTGRAYYRSRYNNVWTPWREMVNDQSVTAIVFAGAAGPAGAIPNFDSYTTPGVYVTTGATSNDQDWLLEVFSQPNGNLYQRRTTTVGSNKVMVRFRRGTTWTAWSLVGGI